MLERWSASSSNCEDNLHVKAVRLSVTTRSHTHIFMCQTNKTIQTGLLSDLFINSRKKLRIVDFYCDQLRRRDIPLICSFSVVAYAKHMRECLHSDLRYDPWTYLNEYPKHRICIICTSTRMIEQQLLEKATLRKLSWYGIFAPTLIAHSMLNAVLALTWFAW